MTASYIIKRITRRIASIMYSELNYFHYELKKNEILKCLVYLYYGLSFRHNILLKGGASLFGSHSLLSFNQAQPIYNTLETQ